jgi:hypothetical protein
VGAKGACGATVGQLEMKKLLTVKGEGAQLRERDLHIPCWLRARICEWLCLALDMNLLLDA